MLPLAFILGDATPMHAPYVRDHQYLTAGLIALTAAIGFARFGRKSAPGHRYHRWLLFGSAAGLLALSLLAG